MTRSRDLPSQETPNSSIRKTDARGNLIQVRYYGPDGRAAMNIDFGHDHTGVGDPHAHDWDWTKIPPRQASRPLNPGE